MYNTLPDRTKIINYFINKKYSFCTENRKGFYNYIKKRGGSPCCTDFSIDS